MMPSVATLVFDIGPECRRLVGNGVMPDALWSLLHQQGVGYGEAVDVLVDGYGLPESDASGPYWTSLSPVALVSGEQRVPLARYRLTEAGVVQA